MWLHSWCCIALNAPLLRLWACFLVLRVFSVVQLVICFLVLSFGSNSSCHCRTTSSMSAAGNGLCAYQSHHVVHSASVYSRAPLAVEVQAALAEMYLILMRMGCCMLLIIWACPLELDPLRYSVFNMDWHAFCLSSTTGVPQA